MKLNTALRRDIIDTQTWVIIPIDSCDINKDVAEITERLLERYPRYRNKIRTECAGYGYIADGLNVQFAIYICVKTYKTLGYVGLLEYIRP